MWRRRQLIGVLALSTAACSVDRFAPATDGGVNEAAADGAGGDGATAVDSATDAPLGPRISCGPSTCAVGQTCCAYVNLGSAKYECHAACPPPQNGDQLSALKCSGTADCASGQVCCIERTGAQNASVCSAGPCTGNQVQLCDPAAPNPGCSSSTCSSNNISDWKLPGTFGTCGGVPVP